MDWARGFKTAYHACIVDSVTWMDKERFAFESGSISRTDSGLRQSADIDCVNYSHGSDKWIRIYMDVTQDGSSEHIPVFTGLTSAPKEQIKGGYIDTPVECYSVLKPAADERLEVGWFAAKGYVGTDVIKSLLSVCDAPVDIAPGSPRLSDYIVAEANETRLTMTDTILDAIGWRLRIDGDGTIRVMPKATEPVATFSSLGGNSIEVELERVTDWFDCPNVLRASTESDSVTVTDDDPNSPLSTVTRGRRVWAEERSAALSSGESLWTYAERRLKELQSVATELAYTREFHPDVMPSDIVSLHYPKYSIDGEYTVSDQKISLDASGTTDEEVVET